VSITQTTRGALCCDDVDIVAVVPRVGDMGRPAKWPVQWVPRHPGVGVMTPQEPNASVEAVINRKRQATCHHELQKTNSQYQAFKWSNAELRLHSCKEDRWVFDSSMGSWELISVISYNINWRARNCCATNAQLAQVSLRWSGGRDSGR
jgi:hypothetical protein